MNMTKNTRSRVVGNNGPSRKLLPNFKKLGTMSEEFLRDVYMFLDNLGSDYDDLSVIKQEKVVNDGQLVTNCKLAVGDNGETTKDMFDIENMRSIFLQKSNKEVALDEFDYQQPIDGSNIVLDYINSWLIDDATFFRTRINILNNDCHVPPHIDTDTSVYVRLMFMIEGEQEFFIKRRGQVSSVKMQQGDVYFINQGWTHWVENLTQTDKHRTVLLISCKWKDVSHYFTWLETRGIYE